MGISQEERVQVVELMLSGQSWQGAIEEVGLPISEATAYRWVRVWRAEGEAGLSDGRQGHTYKMTAEVREWLQTYCTEKPDTASGELRQQLQERFGVAVSRGHVNLVRRELGVSQPKKKGP